MVPYSVKFANGAKFSSRPLTSIKVINKMKNQVGMVVQIV